MKQHSQSTYPTPISHVASRFNNSLSPPKKISAEMFYPARTSSGVSGHSFRHLETKPRSTKRRHNRDPPPITSRHSHRLVLTECAAPRRKETKQDPRNHLHLQKVNGNTLSFMIRSCKRWVSLPFTMIDTSPCLQHISPPSMVQCLFALSLQV